MIGLSVMSNHLIYHSGITTFLYHLIDIYKEDNIVICTDKKVDSSIKHTTNIEALNSCSVVIANCIESLQLIINNVDNSKIVFYTHYPFLLDVQDSQTQILKNITHIPIFTQTHGLKMYLSEIFNNKIYVLPQPFSTNYIIKENLLPKQNRALIISSGDIRKNYELMISCLSKANIPVTCICNSEQLYVKLLFQKYNFKKYKIIPNINNKYIGHIIKQHKFLLHLGEQEIFPYSIYESMFYIPCIISGWTKWGKSFIEADNVLKVPKDEDAIIETIHKVFNNDYYIDNSNIAFEAKNKWIKQWK